MKRLPSASSIVTVLALLALGLVAFAPAARADWNVGDPYKMHYPQLPDLTPAGMDILATLNPANPPFYKILADDFRCTATAPISDIHIWGSWLNDQPGLSPMFKLSIHLDDRTGLYSKPGPEVWSAVFSPAQYTARIYGTGPEQFFDPNLNQVIGSDTVVWQYNFQNIVSPFMQEEGKIYWLDVQVWDPLQPTALFGWKTTNPLQTPHFEDDAVFGDTLGFNGPLEFPPGWRELVYPPGHPFAGQSIDLAFVITPEPGAAAFFGLGLLALLTFRRRD